MNVSHVMRKTTMWFPNRSDTNRAVQAQKMARDWKFWNYKVEGLYYPCSEADLCFRFCLCKMFVFFHDTAHLI